MEFKKYSLDEFSKMNESFETNLIAFDTNLKDKDENFITVGLKSDFKDVSDFKNKADLSPEKTTMVFVQKEEDTAQDIIAKYNERLELFAKMSSKMEAKEADDLLEELSHKKVKIVSPSKLNKM